MNKKQWEFKKKGIILKTNKMAGRLLDMNDSAWKLYLVAFIIIWIYTLGRFH